MATTFQSRTRIFDYWKYEDDDTLATAVDEKTYEYELELTNGTGDNQAQKVFRKRSTLASNTDEEFDVAGALVDSFGNTLTFGTVKQILIVNKSTVAGGVITLGQLATPTGGNLLTDLFDGDNGARIKIRPGPFLIATGLTGYTVTGGSADVLLVSNKSAVSVTFDIIIKGT